jgi:hypothetical protein
MTAEVPEWAGTGVGPSHAAAAKGVSMSGMPAAS